MTTIDQMFAALRREGRKAFIPFVTAGDPDLEFTSQVIRQFAAEGASLCEVGIPYSDPIADGPVVQASYTRALERGIELRRILEMLGALQPQLAASRSAGALPMPLVTMVSYAIVHRWGPQRYVQAFKEAGVQGMIVPDLLVEESAEVAAVCRDHDFNLIQLVTPTTPRERAVRIAEVSTGFLYYVSVTGITGERQELPTQLVENVHWLRQRSDLPICVGFGISQPQQAKQLAQVADGVIVGSALVRRVAQVETEGREAVLQQIAQFTREMLEALRG